MKSVIDISEQQLNEIQNSSSVEFLKSLIIDNIENDDIDILNNDLISVRILSLNEWNKYIENDTLDGSITKNSDNVWHFCNPTPSTTYNIQKRYSTDGYNNVLTYNFNFFWTARQNNKLSAIDFAFSSYSYKFYLVFYGPGSTETCNGTLTTTAYSTTNKTTAYILSNSGDYIARSNQPNWLRVKTYAYHNMCFRPVFQYVDNNKSNNMFF